MGNTPTEEELRTFELLGIDPQLGDVTNARELRELRRQQANANLSIPSYDAVDDVTEWARDALRAGGSWEAVSHAIIQQLDSRRAAQVLARLRESVSTTASRTELSEGARADLAFIRRAANRDDALASLSEADCRAMRAAGVDPNYASIRNSRDLERMKRRERGD